MGFSDNLQYLRAERNMTQEQLAMLLGVSRQAISKWEGDKAYPEMDKLLMICDLFGVTLDDLVIGDVRASEAAQDGTDGDGAPRPKAASGTGIGPLPEASALPQDITGYDEHMRSFDMRISAGVFAVVFGVGVGLLFTGEHAIPVAPSIGDFLVFLCISIGVLVGLACFIPAGLGHAEFMRRHPFVEDFYTREDRQQATRTLTVSLIFGIGLILIAVGFIMVADSVMHMDEGWPVALFMMIVAGGATACTYGGMNYARVNVEEYNKEAVHEERSRRMDTAEGVNGAICGTIMILATIAGLSMLFFFNGGPNGMFWMAWVIGGLLCGISSIITNAIADRNDRS